MEAFNKHCVIARGMLSLKEHDMDVKGQFKGCLNDKNKTAEQDIYVVSGLSKPLLGLPAIEALTLIQRSHTVQERQEDIIGKYPGLIIWLKEIKRAI